jgi:hypothetical protein
VFLYWRCLHGNSKLIDYHADLEISSIPEKLKGDELIQISRRYAYYPIWMSTKEFVDYPQAQQKFPHLRLLFHCDRFN